MALPLRLLALYRKLRREGSLRSRAKRKNKEVAKAPPPQKKSQSAPQRKGGVNPSQSPKSQAGLSRGHAKKEAPLTDKRGPHTNNESTPPPSLNGEKESWTRREESPQ